MLPQVIGTIHMWNIKEWKTFTLWLVCSKNHLEIMQKSVSGDFEQLSIQMTQLLGNESKTEVVQNHLEIMQRCV